MGKKCVPNVNSLTPKGINVFFNPQYISLLSNKLETLKGKVVGPACVLTTGVDNSKQKVTKSDVILFSRPAVFVVVKEITMSISDKTADDLLVKCGRHCCICRRFEPLHLQIHHIKEESEGGSNDFDNLIAICLTCHSDVHTHTKLTRRFTVEELKGHRDEVIKMVAAGTLTSHKIENDDSDELINGLFQRLVYKADYTGSDIELPPHAVKILLDAIQKTNGLVYNMSDNLRMNSTLDDIREASKLKDGINELEEKGLLDYVKGIVYRVSHKGFLLADKLIALSDTTEKQ